MNPLLAAIVLSTLSAQGTKADYDRAAALPALARDKVRAREVRPRWSEDGARMIYTANWIRTWIRLLQCRS